MKRETKTNESRIKKATLVKILDFVIGALALFVIAFVMMCGFSAW